MDRGSPIQASPSRERRSTPRPAGGVDARRHDLDALRAAAMLLGIVLHAALAFSTVPWPVQDSHRSDAFSVLFFFIHGFRMPLFFVLSGYFTAMLWKRRGLRALLEHRARRVLFPLMLGLVTVIPAVRVSIAIGSRVPAAGGGIFEAARRGDLAELESLLDGGADPDAEDGIEVTALHWAAGHGRAEACELLLARGAEVDAFDGKGATPLQWAAFLGRDRVAAMLLEAGADPDHVDDRGATARRTVNAPWSVEEGRTLATVGGLLGIEVDEAEVRAGRNAIAEQIGGDAAAAGGATRQDQEATEDGLEALVGLLVFLMFFLPIFDHLWFLWFLCWIVAAFAFLAWLSDRFAVPAPSPWLVASPLALTWLVPLTLLPQLVMHELGERPGFGPDTSMGLVPFPHLLFYYGIFFGFGALVYGADRATALLSKGWPLWLGLALVGFVPALALSTHSEAVPAWIDDGARRNLAAGSQALFAWLMVFGSIGMVGRLLRRERAWVRYLSDSSYWMYLAHLPLVYLLQGAARAVDGPAPLEFAAVVCVAFALLLASYAFFVRPTWIGRFLNGPRS